MLLNMSKTIVFATENPEIPLCKFDELQIDKRQGILSHREQLFAKLFEIIK